MMSNHPPSDIETRTVDFDLDTLSEAHSSLNFSRGRCVEHPVFPA